jgi:hypothetical protein
VLEGELEDFTLPDILRLLAATSKTGRLALQHEGAAGRVDLSDGRVREATADGERLAIARRLLGAGLVTADDLEEVLRGHDVLPSDLELARGVARAGVVESGTLAEVVREQTVDAVFDLLRWRAGSFRFDGDPLDARSDQVLDLAVPVEEVLSEAFARLESWPAVAERTGDGGAVVTISRPRGERAPFSLPPDAWALLSFVDGRRTVTELAHLSGQGEFRTRRTLGAMLDEGVVAVGAQGGPSHVERLLAAHGRLATLEHALRRRPVGADPATVTDTMVAPAPPASCTISVAAPDAPDSAPTVDGTRPAASRALGLRSDDLRQPGRASVRSEERSAATMAEPALVPSASRGARLRTEPPLDADLVRRLIDGVESL